MGYFSNGTEHDMYVAEYCERCQHNDEQAGCPVMNLHWLWNYDQTGKDDTAKAKAEALTMLIPRGTDGFNDKCTMFCQAG